MDLELITSQVVGLSNDSKWSQTMVEGNFIATIELISDGINSAKEELAKSAHKLAEEAYKAAQEKTQTAQSDQGNAQANPEEKKDDDTVVDAEVVDEEEENKE